MAKNNKKEKVKSTKNPSLSKIKLKSADEVSEFTENENFIQIGKELAFQKEEKKKRAAELIIANKELVFQNAEKEKRAAELIIKSKLNLLKAKVWEAVSNKSIERADLINLMLEEAGNILNISRAAFLELDEGEKIYVTKYQWYRPEVGSTKKVLIPKKYVEQYSGQDSVQIPRQLNKITRLFASPILKLYNIKSYLAVPFGNKSNPIGLFSFTDCMQERVWTDLEIEALIDLSKILESFSIQREAEKMLIESEENIRVIL